MRGLKAVQIRRQTGAVLALLAILLNFALPISHGEASADKGGFVEICTSAGIKLVADNDAVNAADTASHMGEDCAQCITCPLCQIQSNSHDLALPLGEIIAVADMRAKAEFETIRNQTDQRSGYDQPQSRAPPFA